MDKRRILFVNEASFVSSGFGTYGKELLNRLYDTGKYEIAELACYGRINDPKDKDTRWKYYANLVAPDDPRHKEYQGNSTNAFGQWRFDRTLLDFKPDIVCTPPGELILTDKGYIAIENVCVGDKVMTHTGNFQKVIRVMRRSYNGPLYHVYYKGCKKPLKLTPNHPVYIYKKRNQTNQKKSFKKIYDGIEPEFIPVQNLRQNDLIVLPIPQLTNNPIQTIKVTDYLSNFIQSGNKVYPRRKTKCNPIKDIIKINHDFGTLMGYIIGDGNINRGGIRITFNKKETRFVNSACTLFNKCFGISCKIRPYKKVNAIDVIICSTILSQFFQNFNPNKFVFDNDNFAKGLVCGLVRTDGCYKKNTVSFCSTNPTIAYLYHMVCLRLGIPTNIQYKKHLPYKDVYDVEGYGDSAQTLHNIAKKHVNINCPNNTKKSCRTTQIVNNKYLISSIIQIDTVNYQGNVYNLEVENDNSYIIHSACVHNCDIKDPWMLLYQKFSPYRPYFYWMIMVTCDSAPQSQSWMDGFINADCLLAYNDWSLEVLKRESGYKARTFKSAPSCYNPTHCYPIEDKVKNRLQFGLMEDINIVGTVMRNQKRKLFPDLFKAFGIFLQMCNDNNNEELAKKTYLYCHTSFPDLGWDFPQLIKENGLGNKILFTYICRVCNNVFPAFFKDARTICPFCNSISAVLPSVAFGVSTEQLGKIMNCFNYYIQYSICEGMGMPPIEAAACGVPVAEVDYSAMEDVVRKLNGDPIRIGYKFRELETGADRVYPDNKHCAQLIYNFFTAPESYRQERIKTTLEGVKKHYQWDKTTKIWEEAIDNAQLTGLQGKWDAPLRHNEPQTKVPNGLNNEQFVEWLYTCVVHEPENINSYDALTILRELNYGARLEGRKVSPINRQQYIDRFIAMQKNKNMCELARCGKIPIVQHDYIDYANLKEKLQKKS